VTSEAREMGDVLLAANHDDRRAIRFAGSADGDFLAAGQSGAARSLE